MMNVVVERRTIDGNCMKNVSVFDIPFAPLGLAIGWINGALYTFHLSEVLKNHISAPAVLKRVSGIENSLSLHL